mmetsp:Transcript_39607/g.29244  ORF Transcript_39607/g.29244 Transcript_39607/m.29244 type:complete len:87 (+) Transcript_39607:320-580(+)
MCPYYRSQCSNTTDIYLDTVDQTKEVQITNLSRGNSCFYKVKTFCGAPAVRPDNTNDVQIEFVEFNSQQLNASQPVAGSGYASNAQ